MVVEEPILLPKDKGTLILPQDIGKVHPLWDRVKLTHFRLCGKPSKVRAFQAGLPKLCVDHGERARNGSMGVISKDKPKGLQRSALD